MTAVLIWSGFIMVWVSSLLLLHLGLLRRILLMLSCSPTSIAGDVDFDCSLQKQQPADDVLLMLQLAVAKEIIAKDGAGGLYKGLSAGLLRQATYTTARLGMFQIFSDLLKQQNQGKVHWLLHLLSSVGVLFYVL